MQRSYALTILVTGGAGFIGANFVLEWMRLENEPVVNLDALTYAGNLSSLARIADHPNHTFVKGDICDTALVESLLKNHRPRAILHFAAETHVDRSIDSPESFVNTNILGTFRLLESARVFWAGLPGEDQSLFRFVNVSTDEVFGSVEADDPACDEEHAYAPNSPYSASKAAADHLVRSYFHTYGLPAMTTNGSNNYGPFQFPEKLIPLIIVKALQNETLPVYGDGSNVRDWLYVTDHCSAIRALLVDGTAGESYNIGGNRQLTNIDVVTRICDLLDELAPTERAIRRDLITFVTDRPGHDRRYAIDSQKIIRQTGWAPAEAFDAGLRKTVQWYLDNNAWLGDVNNSEHRSWIDLHYGTN